MSPMFVEQLLCFAKERLFLQEDDTVYYRNFLLHELGFDKAYKGDIDEEEILEMDVPDYFNDEMLKRFVELGLSEAEAEKKVTYIFGELMPLPSQVRKRFYDSIADEDPQAATDNYYKLCVMSNYVQKTKIDRNINLLGHVGNNDIIAAINLSKPEKSNKDIAKALKSNDEDNYPSCPICADNEGCFGSKKTGPRNNLRVIPMKLAGKTWYMQYSPYGYFNEHCVVTTKDHVPMKVCKENLAALFDFVDLLPHYFIGSNSDLPIVGGSILGHEHFQGGCFEMPIFRAGILKEVPTAKYENVNGYILDYPGTVFKFVSDDKEEMLDLLDNLLHSWQSYDNEKLQIIAEGHNTMTTIVRKVSSNYVVYAVLRNNRCDEAHPEGIFHTRKSLHNIKAEGIGLIEICGNCVLPPRLKRQLDLVYKMIANPEQRAQILKDSPDMNDFLPMLERLDKEGKDYDIAGKLYEGCHLMLKDIDVFKYDDENHTQFNDFIKCLN